MALATGKRLGNYEVVDLLGAGGMGEVYRARDTHLGRDVALKVLPSHLADNPERLDRFEREARLLAALNHPNVATLHGLEHHDGTHVLVMELVEGETLAARIARGRLGWREALDLFQQIADGLGAAHEKGVIHRDLKPANIMIARDGRVKVLDFGLAKAFGAEMTESASSHSPTVTRDHTATGVILGTAAYMSPEQARGRPTDKRTDVWAFGCCLYEALTGRPAFLGETVSDTIAAILEREPDWSGVPGRLMYLLQRTLRKDANERIRDIADARILLEASPEEETGAVTRAGTGAALVALSAIALIASAVAIWAVLFKDNAAAREVTRARLPLEEGTALVLHLSTPAVTISPDGRHVAYLAENGTGRHLYLRALSSTVAQRVKESAGARSPFFSHDSQWLAFHANGAIRRVPVSGGATTVLTNIVGSTSGASALPSGHIVLSRSANQGLDILNPQTGEIRTLTEPNRDEREKGHRLPDVLPGGGAVLFTSSAFDITSFDDAKIRVLDLETNEVETLIEGGTAARYSASGHILYYRADTLFAAPFDKNMLRLAGPPVAVQEGVAASWYAQSAFAVAENGTLVFAPGGRAGTDNQLVWIDRTGRKEPIAFDAPIVGELASVTLSPDESRGVVETGGATDQIWIHDFERSGSTRLTYEWDNLYAVWSPDGKRIAFASGRGGAWDLYARSASGDDDLERITDTERSKVSHDWFPDGETIIYEERGEETGDDLWLVPLGGERVPRPFARSKFHERGAKLSPDGGFVAYHSNESGRWEIYVRRVADARTKMPVSTGGGRAARWHPDGAEIYYWEEDRLMAVEVSQRGGSLTLAAPVLLFESDSLRRELDVARDGRFIGINTLESELPTELEIVLNWAEDLKRLAPATN